MDKFTLKDLVNFDISKLPDEILGTLYDAAQKEVSRRRNNKVGTFKRVCDLNKLVTKGRNQHSKNSNTYRRKLFDDVLADDWSAVYPNLGGPSDYYVYIHMEPLAKFSSLSCVKLSDSFSMDGLPFYVGKGIGNRAYDLKRNEGHGAKIRSLLSLGTTPDQIVLIFKSGLTESEALCLESKLIYFFGTKFKDSHGILVNLTVPPTPYD